MTTIITHAAVPLAAAICLGPTLIPRRLMLLGMLASMLPDADVIGFKLGIAYLDQFGHRGASHSLVFAALVGLLAAFAAPALQAPRMRVFAFIALACASHGLLDMCTNGGEGVALFWPLSSERFFFPWHEIAVSPIALRKVFSARGLAVLQSELIWVWLPLTILTASVLLGRRQMQRR